MAGQLVTLLTEAMAEKKWREADLVRETGLTQSRINRLLRGATRDPEPDLFREVARALDLPVEAVVQAHADDMRTATLARVLGAPEVALAGAASHFPRGGDSTGAEARGVGAARGGRGVAAPPTPLGPADQPVPAWGVALMESVRELSRVVADLAKRTAAPVLAAVYIMHAPTAVEAIEIRREACEVSASCDSVAPGMFLIRLWRRLRDWTRSLAPRHTGHAPALVNKLAWAS